MEINIIGAISSTIGVLLSLWAIWYAKLQSNEVSKIRKNELLFLWTHFDRVKTLLMHIKRITNAEGFIESENLSNYQQQHLLQIFKGFYYEYIRAAELIVQKIPNISLNYIEKWADKGRFKSDWQKQQFINLLPDNSNEI